MSETRDALVNIFAQLAKNVRALTDEDIADILSGKFDFKLVVNEGKRKKAAKTAGLNEAALGELAARLKALDNREDGAALLAKICKKKDDLKTLARNFDIPILSKDTVASLRDKIIEAAIGYRLRSKAIQDTNTVDPKKL